MHGNSMHLNHKVGVVSAGYAISEGTQSFWSHQAGHRGMTAQGPGVSPWTPLHCRFLIWFYYHFRIRRLNELLYKGLRADPNSQYVFYILSPQGAHLQICSFPPSFICLKTHGLKMWKYLTWMLSPSKERRRQQESQVISYQILADPLV